MRLLELVCGVRLSYSRGRAHEGKLLFVAGTKVILKIKLFVAGTKVILTIKLFVAGTKVILKIPPIPGGKAR